MVDHFMIELYQSAAEPLPDGFLVDGPWSVGGLSVGDDAAQVWNPDATLPEELRQLACDFMGVPVRHLPHGRLHDLYLQFLAWHDANMQGGEPGVARVAGVASDAVERAPASFSTFWRRWRDKWSSVLRFRKSSQHSCCQVCFDLKEAIEAARGDLKLKLQHARVLREHLRAQYQDRCVYWSLRWASRQYNNVLVVIIDSMDKAKFAVPRYRFGEKPKELEKFVRPRLVCTAAVAHGWVTAVYLSDEALNHGSDCFVEVVLRVMTKVWQVSQETGRPMPQHLVIQADNTTAQCKNQVAVLFLALLVSRFKFQTTNLMFLRVGHTHEDVGRGLATCTCWWGMDEIRSIQLAEKCR